MTQSLSRPISLDKEGRRGEGAGKNNKSDVFLNHYTASATLCVTLSLPPSAADCQMSTSPTTATTTITTNGAILRPCGQITVRRMISRQHFYGWLMRGATLQRLRQQDYCLLISLA